MGRRKWLCGDLIPASFFDLPSASHVAAASCSHFFMKLSSAAPASFFSPAWPLHVSEALSPTASAIHFFMWLSRAAPASFFDLPSASHAAAASCSHLVMKLVSAAPASFFRRLWLCTRRLLRRQRAVTKSHCASPLSSPSVLRFLLDNQWLSQGASSPLHPTSSLVPRSCE